MPLGVDVYRNTRKVNERIGSIVLVNGRVVPTTNDPEVTSILNDASATLR